MQTCFHVLPSREAANCCFPEFVSVFEGACMNMCVHIHTHISQTAALAGAVLLGWAAARPFFDPLQQPCFELAACAWPHLAKPVRPCHVHYLLRRARLSLQRSMCIFPWQSLFEACSMCTVLFFRVQFELAAFALPCLAKPACACNMHIPFFGRACLNLQRGFASLACSLFGRQDSSSPPGRV